MSETLTYEQLYGEPAKQGRLAADEGICPYEKIRCPAWDSRQGCIAEFCVMKAAEVQAVTQANPEV